MSVEETKKLIIDSNFINEKDDTLPYLIILGALQIGIDKQKVREWLGSCLQGRVKEFKRMWKLAEDNKIFVDGCISVEDVDEGLTDVELGLYGMVLTGYVTRHID